MTTRPGRRAVFHPLRVADIEPLTDDAVAVTFEVPEPLRADYRFDPGQHVTVRAVLAGQEVRRTYSICAPAGSRRLRIGVRRVAGGLFSTYATSGLAAGDTLEVATPTGNFRLLPEAAPAGRHLVAIAAGSGITPVLSIVASALAAEPATRVTLVYANRTTASVMFLEELADLKDRHPDRLHLLHVLSREPVGSELSNGRLDADRLRTLLDGLIQPEGVDEWYLCGPQSLVETAQRALAEHKVDPDRIHLELFQVAGAQPVARPVEPGAAPTGVGSQVTVVLDGRSSAFELAADGPSLLDATLAVRADAPYACKGGVCGTCRALLVQGEVRMDTNYALEADELAAGFVLACQSHPVSERVRLDFDR